MFVPQLINGLTQGSIYALIAIGFVIIFGTMNLVTFAHGEVYMAGAFAGYFALTGILDDSLSVYLSQARNKGIFTSLDVVRSERMDKPEGLWSCLPQLDVFLCNAYEGWRLSGKKEPSKIAEYFHSMGTRAVIIKMGAEGCWLSYDGYADRIPSVKVETVDTTGAGDGFAAGLLSALAKGDDFLQACRIGNEIGARVVRELGAVRVWLKNR